VIGKIPAEAGGHEFCRIMQDLKTTVYVTISTYPATHFIFDLALVVFPFYLRPGKIVWRDRTERYDQ